ncbi:MAG TPA: CBS domain-containing protein, partial [Candidatus Korarchaeota archaeon]|nr:CBS domain-containing protein [Candidatus Korarchaeota archaeon]
MGRFGFFERLSSAPLAATFGDFILLPGKVKVEPSEVDLSTRLTPEIRLSLPMLSSPMDTVTEVDMAVGMARLGGLGVLHRNCSLEEQVSMARAVKRAESFIIRNVVTIAPDATVAEARELMRSRGISGLPVVEAGRLLGIVTRRDVSFAPDDGARVREVMTREPVTVGRDVTLDQARDLMWEHRIEKLPVVDSEGRLLGLITARDIAAMESRPNSTRGPEGRLRVAAAVSPFDVERARALDRWVDALVIDVAHFHNENVISATARLAKEVSAELIVGNVGTREAAVEAITRVEEARALRVGVGSGSICTTGEVTGVAAPTLF